MTERQSALRVAILEGRQVRERPADQLKAAALRRMARKAADDLGAPISEIVFRLTEYENHTVFGFYFKDAHQ